MEFVDKAELLRRMARERARFLALLESPTQAQIEQRGVVGEWSIKEVMAHFASHEQFALAELAYAQRGERFTPAANIGEQINTLAALASRAQTLDEVMQQWRRSYEQVVAAIEALDEAAFDPNGLLVAALGDTIDGAFGNNTYGHYAEHRAQIEQWLGAGAR
jgi:hypothetical protein